MNIALYTDTPFPIVDGVGRVVEAYARTLSGKGHNCFIATPKAKSSPQESDGEDLDIIRFAGLPFKNLPYSLGLPFVDIGFNAKINRQHIDVVHVHSPFSAGISGASVAFRRKIPLIGTFHSKYYDDFYQITRMKTASEICAKLVAGFYQKCDEVWAVSRSTADTLREYGYKGDVFVIDNGTDKKEPNAEQIGRAKAEYQLDGRPVILFVGQMSLKKNPLFVLESCAELKKLGGNFRLIFAGQGPDYDEILSKSAELGLSDETVFTGHITDRELLDALYFSSSLLFFPSYYDNAPMVVREAAAAGVPSILAEGSSAAEVVVDGENGILCSDDPLRTAAQIKTLLNEPDKLRQMGTRAKETIAADWGVIIDRVLQRYKSLAARKH